MMVLKEAFEANIPSSPRDNLAFNTNDVIDCRLR